MIARLRYLIILISTSLFVLVGCDGDENQNQNKPLRNVQFKIAAPKSGTQAGKTAAINADALLVSIEDEDGVPYYSMEQVEIYQLNDGYISVPVSLPQGSYKLTLFALVDSDDNIIAATPTEDSPVAEFVTDPLPIEFDVTSEETTYLNPEVLVIEEGMDIGYAVFGIEVVKIYPITVSVFENNEGVRNLISASLTMEGYKQGAFSWTKSVELDADTNTFYIKGGMELYNFKVTKSGYYPLNYWISSVDLKNNPNQVFDMIKVGTQLKSLTSEVYCCPGSGFVPTKTSFTYNAQHLLTKTTNQYQSNNQWAVSYTINNTYSGDLVPSQVKYNITGGTYILFNNTVTNGIITSMETVCTASSNLGDYTISLTRDPNSNRITDAVIHDKDYNTDLNYHYTYDAQGDLVVFEAKRGNSDLLYRGEFTYDNYANVYPGHMLGDWLENMTNNGYEDLLHIPFMINKPKHNIVGYTLFMYTGVNAVYSKETITMNYSYNNQGLPSSLEVHNLVEVTGFSPVSIDRQKNTFFEYYN